jgi:hypothetical protein
MGFDNTDKNFAIKMSFLFIVLIIGVVINRGELVLKNANQDILKIENNKPSIVQTISIKKSNSQQLYHNTLR